MIGLFRKKNKVEETKKCSCHGESQTASEKKTVQDISKKDGIIVLGSGCAKCNQLEENVVEALKELGMDVTIQHVTDFTQIASYGVMSTPALVIDGKVVSYGKVLSKEEAMNIIKKTRGLV